MHSQTRPLLTISHHYKNSIKLKQQWNSSYNNNPTVNVVIIIFVIEHSVTIDLAQPSYRGEGSYLISDEQWAVSGEQYNMSSER